MKKILKIIAITFLMLAVVAAVVICITSGYFSDIQWRDISADKIEIYLNEKVIPIVVVVVTAVGTVMMAILPVMNGVKRASEKFSSAEEGLKNTSADTKKTQGETKEIVEAINKHMEDMHELCLKADEKMEDLASMESRIEEMMLIGFCNTPDLVRGGYASMIYEMSTKNKKDTDGDKDHTVDQEGKDEDGNKI